MEIASLLLHENSLRVYSTILIPHFKRYLQISLATPTHFRFLVPPIFVKNVKATVLYTYIVLTSMYFVNVCIAGLGLSLKALDYWCSIAFSGLTTFPLLIYCCRLPPPKSFVAASVCIRTCAGGWINNRLLRPSKFTIHHCNIVFEWWFRTICCWFERLSFKDDIYLSWRYWHCNFAGNTAWIDMSANRSLLLIVKSFFFFFFLFCQ